jgi:hypothetical protein
MIKLTEILQDILAEKKLCKKGRAYYNRRRAAGEKPSAYLSGRAVKVCKGLMEGDEETVECAKCGWRWDLENGGENPYLCHKCGYDNSYKYNDDLEEAKQAGILYHWTSLKNLEDIIKTNTIRPAYSEFDDEDNGVSLTRSKNKHQFGIAEAADCVIVLDGDKLSNNYKIKPYNDLEVAQYDDFGIFDEMEERLLGSIKNLNKYIVKIILYKSDPKIESLLKEKNIPYELNLNESLRDWFKKEDWVRIDTAGNITGPCGTMKKGNKTTRCLPRAKANSLTKAERAATSKKKAASDKQFVPNTKKAKVRLNK